MKKSNLENVSDSANYGLTFQTKNVEIKSYGSRYSERIVFFVLSKFRPIDSMQIEDHEVMQLSVR